MRDNNRGNFCNTDMCDMPDDRKKSGPQKCKPCKVVRPDCKCNRECASCVIASTEACNAPQINRFLNLVNTPVYSTYRPAYGEPLPHCTIEQTFYVALPCDNCHEHEVLWNLSQILQNLFNLVNDRYAATNCNGPHENHIEFKFALNIVSNKMIVDAGYAIQAQNTNRNGMFTEKCGLKTATRYVYLIHFDLQDTGSFYSITGARVIFNGPNDEVYATYRVTFDNDGEPEFNLVLPAESASTDKYGRMIVLLSLLFNNGGKMSKSQAAPFLKLLGVEFPKTANFVSFEYDDGMVKTIFYNNNILLNNEDEFAVPTTNYMPVEVPAWIVKIKPVCDQGCDYSYVATTGDPKASV